MPGSREPTGWNTQAPAAATLSPDLAKRVAAWIEAARGGDALRFPELRKGVQALSTRYVEARPGGRVGAGALGGAGLRAAFACFYAPLHFLAAHALAAELPGAFLSGVRRVVDLGAGTGAVGAALALASGARTLLALDRSGWALAEARRTFGTFGLHGRTRRVELPAGVPRLGTGDLVTAGYLLNELEPALRERLAGRFDRALADGARLVVLEPLARGVSPWWDDLAGRLRPAGAVDGLYRWTIERPDWIARLDTASGLDHREIGVRVLFGPAASRTSE